MPVDVVVFLTRGEEFDGLLPSMRARHIPMVGVEGQHEEGVALVDIDDASGMAVLARHVRDLGHTRIGVVMRSTRIDANGPPGPIEPVDARLETISNRTIRERLRAVASVFPDATRVEAGGRELDSGEIAAGRILDQDSPPTAILAQNDMLAVGALRADDGGAAAARTWPAGGSDGGGASGRGSAIECRAAGLLPRGRHVGAAAPLR
jgi:DNA-binding LacI/PurR family transcriptional regulator